MRALQACPQPATPYLPPRPPPCAPQILTMVSFSTFWISPASGERLGLAITVPLAVAVYDLLVFSSLPTSNKINFVSALGLLAFLFSAAVLVENAIASEQAGWGGAARRGRGRRSGNGAWSTRLHPQLRTCARARLQTRHEHGHGSVCPTPPPPPTSPPPAVQLYFYRESTYFASMSSIGRTMVSYHQQTQWVKLLKVGRRR
jgi:hypothetical protein